MRFANCAAALLVGAVVVGGLVAGGGVRAASRPAVMDYMPKLGFSAKDLAALERGEAVARVLEKEMVGANDTAEVAVAGAIRVDVPRQVFIDAVKNVKGFRNSSHLKIGIIQNPPESSDFAGVVIPEDDVKDLKKCKPGNCALKLMGTGLEELQASVNWKAPDHREQVNRIARKRLFQLTSNYVKQGTKAFEPLEDKKTPVSLDQQFRELLAKTSNLIAFYPELATYLRDYPDAKLASSQDVFFWTLKDFGLKPTVTITHAVGYMPEGTEDAVVAWKQVYASHYFNGGLSITTYAKDGDASYLVQLDRVRADSLGGMFGGVKRGKMAGAMKNDLEKFLRATRKSLQAAARK
jgi:hypothetical protein